MRARALSLLAMLAASAAAADTPEAAADKVLAAFRAGGDLKELAARDDPDPWLVADELCARGEHDAAEAFARAAPRPDVEKLPGFVASRRGKAVDAAARAALKEVNAALAVKDYAGALGIVGDWPRKSDDAMAAARLAYGKGLALLGLSRRSECAEALLEAGRRARDLGWLARAARAIYEAGNVAWGNSAFPSALVAWEEGLAVDTARGDRNHIARSLNNVGNVCWHLGNYRGGLDVCQRALTLAEELPDRALVATVLTNMGILHSSLGENAKALDFHQRALRIEDELGDRGGAAVTMAKIANIHSARGDYPGALQLYERALTVMQDVGDRASVPTTLQGLGDAHCRLGRYRDAVEAYEQALKLAQEIGDRRRISSVIQSIGMLRLALGDYRTALALLERALPLAEELGLRDGIASVLSNLGCVHKSLGDYRQALGCLQRALNLMEELGDRQGMAAVLTNIGDVHSSLGDYANALSLQRRALALWEETGNRPGLAASLSGMGSSCCYLGEYAKALAFYERWRDLSVEIGDRAGVANALAGLGAVHKVLGDSRTALELYARALELMEELGVRADMARILSNTGHLRTDLGEHSTARSLFERAVALREEIGDRAGVAATLLNLGGLHLRLGDHAKAIDSLERARGIMTELGTRRGVAEALGTTGAVYFAAGDLPKALEYRLRALAAAEQLGETDTVVSLLWGIAEIHYARGAFAEAVAFARRAVAALLRLSSGLAEEQAAQAREQFARVFELGVLAELAIKDEAGVSFFLESGRAMTLIESLGGRQRLQGVVLPEALCRAETDASVAEGSALARYRLGMEQGGDVDALWREVERTRDEALEVGRRLQREAKAQADLVRPEAAPLDRIRAALADGEMLVTYALLTDDAVALLTTRESARVVRLGTSEAITKAAATLQAAVLRPDERGVATPPHERLEFVAQRLRALVVGPLGLEGTKRLLVAPDAQLAYVPFALLAPGIEIAYVPSGTTHGVLLDDAALRGERVLALGDPPAADPEAATVYRGGGELAPLPASRAEAAAVGDVVLVGKDATETGFLASVASQPRWRAVHLACHGLVRADVPELSCLALGADDTNDGFLTVLEVLRAKVPADLVVLSACETAKGKVYRAEGVIGLTRAFMLAGSPRVLCSLWKVDDAATKELMTNFYKEWKPGVGAAAALRKAQQHVASQEKWKDPYFWAAWQLWGLPQ